MTSLSDLEKVEYFPAQALAGYRKLIIGGPHTETWKDYLRDSADDWMVVSPLEDPMYPILRGTNRTNQLFLALDKQLHIVPLTMDSNGYDLIIETAIPESWSTRTFHFFMWRVNSPPYVVSNWIKRFGYDFSKF
jgi:hypothetical protein